ncbi:formylglycine-generating enzyme family protein [Microbacterium sp. UFMG61]|uniref:formylglycine-generating enzyme family protein n=1 Tax=Microbacterium sp. UFMG61 TaxID=2745935 RepID=UPI001E4C292B|nr:formylglycine-generating enzyme family protein [Microbacterium sp. UFMG61]
MTPIERRADTAACGCTPSRSMIDIDGAPTTIPLGTAATHSIEQAAIPPGTFSMGDSSGDHNAGDGELPVHPVTLEGFSIDVTTVTNAAFSRFIRATGHQTDAERFGSSAVFYQHVATETAESLVPADDIPWWVDVPGADWAHPGGPRSSLDGLDDHPVVHVSWNDAAAYAKWAGRHLPTEAQWEYASRGGLGEAKFPWGDEDIASGGWRANIWQGSFPTLNAGEDGWLATAPAREYAPNPWGLFQTVGNVWEWCDDWFSPTYYANSPRNDPAGPLSGGTRVLRGGSFLCHASYCNRYRNSARSANTPLSSMSNAGFRTVSR